MALPRMAVKNYATGNYKLATIISVILSWVEIKVILLPVLYTVPCPPSYLVQLVQLVTESMSERARRMNLAC